MIRPLAALLLTLLLTACGGEAETPQAPESETVAAPPFRTYDAATFYRTTSFTAADQDGFAFSHDGTRLLVGSDETGTYNAFSVDVASAARTALTVSTTSATYPVSWFPGDDRFLYRADGGGDELTHIFVQDADGASRDLTPGDKVRALFLSWSRDRTAFYLLTNERDARAFDVYRYDAASYERALVFENTDALSIERVRARGDWLVLTRDRTSADNDIYLAKLNGKDPAPFPITPHEGNISHSVLGFTADGSGLLYTTNEHSEFSEPWIYDLALDKHRSLIRTEWDTSYLFYSKTGRYQVLGLNEDSVRRAKITTTVDGQPVRIKGLPAGNLQNIRFSNDDRHMAFFVNGSTRPSDLFLVTFGEGGARALTDALNPAIDRSHLVEAEVIRFSAPDNLPIPAILYRPQGADADHPVPAVVLAHGGPGGQFTVSYRAATQHLVNHGYAVLAVNNRGSSGYGKTFYHLDDRRHGEEDLADVVAGGDYLRALDWVDGDRVAVMGGSYGGFLVTAALAFHPDAFAAGIDIFGVTNWVRTLQAIPPWWESFREALYDEMGDPATDEARQRAISPLFHADLITKPMLVIQGANDPRVLQVESDEIVAAVRANGVPVEYVIFPDEGHGFRSRANRITAQEAYLAFLNTHLPGEAPEDGNAKDLPAP